MATPSNNRNRDARPTGGKAGGRAGKPKKPVAGTKDKTVRVPKEWNAKVVDPTNNRGGDQRATGGRAGGRAGKPSGGIARPAAKPTAKPAAKTKIEQLREAAKTKPKSPAPRATVTPKPTAKPNSKTLASRGKAGISMPNSSRAGINLPRAAVNALPKPIGPTTRGMTTATVATGAAKSKLLGRGVAGTAVLGAILNAPAEIDKLKALIRNPKGALSRAASDILSGNTYNPNSVPEKPKKSKKPPIDNEKLFRTGGGRENYGLDKKADPDRKREPVAPLPASVAPRSSGGSSTTPSRGGSTPSRGTSTSPARVSSATTTPPSEQRVSASTANRASGNYGTSKTNNPLMKDMIKRMKDREDKEQSSKAQQLTDKSRQNSGYSSAEKVDGSKYADELKKKRGYSFSTQ